MGEQRDVLGKTIALWIENGTLMSMTKLILSIFTLLSIWGCSGAGAAVSSSEESSDSPSDSSRLTETHADTIAIASITERLEAMAIGDTARAIDTARYGSQDAIVIVSRNSSGFNFQINCPLGGVFSGVGMLAYPVARMAWLDGIRLSGGVRWLE